MIKKDRTLKGTVKLEGSKSITNRVLIIKALCEDFFEIENFSESEDSLTLLELINSREKVLNAKDGGTTLRFLAAFLAVHEGEVILTGNERLIKRPVGPLIDALIYIGADIQYLGIKGYPPLLIRGKMVTDNKVEVDAGISSQFISALLLIAPILQNGLIIKLKGEPVSRPYIQMTLDIMKYFGISYDWSQSVISISHQEYSARDFKVESDWSAASYYYEMAAMADEVDLKVMGLQRMSKQGDAVIATLMEKFGVHTEFIEGGIHITKSPSSIRHFDYDFTDCPDLAQAVIAACAGLNIPGQIKGISNLQIKETDRIAAMQQEILKIGQHLKTKDNHWSIEANGTENNDELLVFDTYNDHRMAMSIVPLSIQRRELVVNDPMVVRKSYPSFWQDIRKLGFEVEELS